MMETEANFLRAYLADIIIFSFFIK